ncbi:hypothetical protein J699_00096 [Acinetobacter sp. 1000160]|nr:hypothetical protein J522_2034 [Acinetobacter baumannii 146457]EYT24112.1 hypothetical protein J699_00096 [Acinetobacter sp. 1000160]
MSAFLHKKVAEILIIYLSNFQDEGLARKEKMIQPVVRKDA